jgi:starch-binding outer membrane protein, SusD/RagB family
MNNNVKIFKHIMAAFVIVLILLITGGCKKFLDRKPLTSTYDDLHQGLLENESLGMYSSLRTYAGFSGLPWLDFHSVRDDDAQKGSTVSDGSEITTMYETFNYGKAGWAPETYWNDHYQMIVQANKLLYDAATTKATDPASLRNIGEAHFFRAYSFFELVKTYGMVPLINYYYTKASDGIKPKSPAADIYAQIDKDLDTASMYLPLNWNDATGNSTFPGRLTSGAAKTLWAQTHLFRSDWGQVVSLCNSVILSAQYKLCTNFADIWRDQSGASQGGKNGPESIWEMQATDGASAQTNSAVDYGSTWGTQQSVRGDGVWNLGWGWNTPTQNLVTAWDNADPRKAYTILYAGQSDGLGGYGGTLPAYPSPSAQQYWNKKIYLGNDPSMRTYTGFVNNNGQCPWINHRILRYADVLLMLAEASNELGDGATAETNLELIRNRASGNLGATRTVVPPIAFVNKDQMRTAIKNERRFEFAMEGYRFYDLVRWTPASDGIDAPNALGGLGYTAKNAFYPYPQTAIDLSGGVLVQNPDY